VKRFLSDAVFTTVSQIVVALVAIGIQVYVVRTVSLSEYGQYATVQAFVLFVEAVFVGRGGEVALQYIGKCWHVDMPRAFWYRSKLLRMDMKANVIIYAITILVGVIFGSFINLNLEWLIILALTIPAQIGYGVWKSVFIVDGRLKQQASFEICYTLILGISVFLLINLAGIAGLLIALVLASFLKTMLARMITQHYWPRNLVAVPPSNNESESGNQFRNANVHAIVRNSFMNGALQGDLLLINALRGPEAVALYKVAKTIAAIPIRVVVPIWVVLRPRIISAMREQSFNRLRRLLIFPAVIFAFIGLLFVWPMLNYGESLIVSIFGDQYSAATPLAYWLIIGTWCFGAITGWLNFACVITTRKLVGSMIYLLWFAGVVVGGMFWGKSSVESMAMVVAASMVAAAFVGWIYFLRESSWIED